MNCRDVVLLFDGIGEVIDEKILSKEIEISELYFVEKERHREFIAAELMKYGVTYPGGDPLVDEWINKYIYDYCMFLRWRPYMSIDCILPYSMGLITALACIGGISFQDGMRLIICSYFYSMKTEQEEMMMLMVVGYDKDELKEIIRSESAQETVHEAANIGPNYILLSGLKKDIDVIKPILRDGGALRLNEIRTPVAYHTDFARNNIEIFEEMVHSLDVQDLTIPICSLYSNDYVRKAESVKNELIINLYSKMKVTTCMEKIKGDGYSVFFEIGATKSLYKIYRSMDEDITILKNLI